MKIKMQRQHNRLHQNKQQGAVLVVSLVMLTIITVIAIGTTSDVGFQANMATNSQISLRAFNASMGQLNTTYNDLKKDDSYQDDLSDILLTKTTISDTVAATYTNPFTINTTVFEIESDEDDSMGGANIHGGELGNAMDVATYTFEINSVSSLPNAAIGSDQTFKIVYEKPPSS